jgi:hypothetical protein
VLKTGNKSGNSILRAFSGSEIDVRRRTIYGHGLCVYGTTILVGTIYSTKCGQKKIFRVFWSEHIEISIRKDAAD